MLEVQNRAIRIAKDRYCRGCNNPEHRHNEPHVWRSPPSAPKQPGPKAMHVRAKQREAKRAMQATSTIKPTEDNIAREKGSFRLVRVVQRFIGPKRAGLIVIAVCECVYCGGKKYKFPASEWQKKAPDAMCRTASIWSHKLLQMREKAARQNAPVVPYPREAPR